MTKYYWTPEKDALVMQLFNEGRNDEYISEQIQFPVKHIKERRMKLNLKRKKTPENLEKTPENEASKRNRELITRFKGSHYWRKFISSLDGDDILLAEEILESSIEDLKDVVYSEVRRICDMIALQIEKLELKRRVRLKRQEDKDTVEENKQVAEIENKILAITKSLNFERQNRLTEKNVSRFTFYNILQAWKDQTRKQEMIQSAAFLKDDASKMRASLNDKRAELLLGD